MHGSACPMRNVTDKTVCIAHVQVLPLAEAAPVDYFTKDLWATALPSQWHDILLKLDEQQLLGCVVTHMYCACDLPLSVVCACMCVHVHAHTWTQQNICCVCTRFHPERVHMCDMLMFPPGFRPSSAIFPHSNAAHPKRRRLCLPTIPTQAKSAAKSVCRNTL